MSSKFQVKLDKKNNRVIKSGPSDFLKLEALMTNKAYVVSRKHEIFCVPKVLSFDSSLGILETELIQDISPLKPLLYDKLSLVALLEKTAEAIFIIHDNIVLDKNEIFYLPNNFMDDDCPNTAIHGDFTLRNVQYDVNKRIPVLIDWSFCPKYHMLANYGSRYFDLAFMVNSIFSSPPYDFIFSDKHRHEMAMHFIKSYFRHMQSTIEYGIFTNYLKKLSRILYKQAKIDSSLLKTIKERRNRLNFIEFANSL
jgi:tRNA A-37 threonylcarbamoyl transferase component Bud32